MNNKNNKQFQDFEAFILKTKVQALIEKCGGDLSTFAAEMVIQSTWLGYIFGTDEYSSEATRDLFELWKAAQAAMVVNLPDHLPPPPHDKPVDLESYYLGIETAREAIEAAGGTVKP